MKTRHLLLAAAVFVIAVNVCCAKPHKHPPAQKKSASQQAQVSATPAPPPKTALPSVQLQYFFDMHLNDIFAPIDAKTPLLPRNQLSELTEGLKDNLATASPDKKAMYEAALGVCDLLARAMDEREKHATNLQAAFAHSLDPAPADRTVNRRLDAVNEVLITTKREWTFRAVNLRKLVDLRYAQERQKERDVAASAKPGT
jgi:hypothetical protein